MMVNYTGCDPFYYIVHSICCVHIVRVQNLRWVYYEQRRWHLIEYFFACFCFGFLFYYFSVNFLLFLFIIRCVCACVGWKYNVGLFFIILYFTSSLCSFYSYLMFTIYISHTHTHTPVHTHTHIMYR